MRFFDIRQCYIKLDADTPEIHYRGGRRLNDLDAILPRIRASLTTYGCALLREFESLGVYSMNSSMAVANSRDRVYTAQRLQKSGVDMPSASLANSPRDIRELIGLGGGTPLAVRLLHAGRHPDTMRAGTDAEALIASARTTGVNLMLQEDLQAQTQAVLRFLVLDNKVLTAVQYENGRRKPRACKSTARERRLAVKAAKNLGLGLAGVDIIRVARGPLVTDVSASPSLEDFEQVSGKDLADRLIAAVEKRLGWKRPASL